MLNKRPNIKLNVVLDPTFLTLMRKFCFSNFNNDLKHSSYPRCIYNKGKLYVSPRFSTASNM